MCHNVPRLTTSRLKHKDRSAASCSPNHKLTSVPIVLSFQPQENAPPSPAPASHPVMSRSIASGSTLPASLSWSRPRRARPKAQAVERFLTYAGHLPAPPPGHSRDQNDEETCSKAQGSGPGQDSSRSEFSPAPLGCPPALCTHMPNEF